MTWGRVIKVLSVVVVLVVVLLAAVWVFQRGLIYLPDDAAVPPAAQVLPGGQDVTLRTYDGLELGAWLVPGGGHAVLIAGGNGGNRLYRAPLAARLAARGMTVLLVDYRGYGGNPGSPSESDFQRDIRVAYQFLRDRKPDRITFYGESLGSAVVTELATEHPPDALVLRSPFVDLAAVGQLHYPFLPARLLLRDRFPVKENLARVRVPTTIVYGSADTVVPAGQSRDVATANGAKLLEIAGADHNDRVLLDGDELIDAIVHT
ncbi:alpha/beta hydrolase [Amycolatopsis sp. NPDC059657]|uniref:alpha/beta hydrolase n=1 Tax=Amycolatopsis sp. NPDC059657 TaxID=3346899 RepID=UPI00366DF8E3